MQKAKAKLGGSPGKVTVTFRSVTEKTLKYKVKTGSTYGDVLNKFVDSPDSKPFLIHGNERVGSFFINGKKINTEKQFEELITKDITIYVSGLESPNVFARLESYKNKEKKEKKIESLKKKLPSTLKLLDNPVNSINFKSARTIKSGTSSSSETEYIDDKDLIVLSTKKIDGNDYYSAYDKTELLKWFDISRTHTLPTRQNVTQKEVDKIKNSLGYGEIIKIRNSLISSSSNSNDTRSPIPVSYNDALAFLKKRIQTLNDLDEYDRERLNIRRIGYEIQFEGKGEYIINNREFNISNSNARTIQNDRYASNARDRANVIDFATARIAASRANRNARVNTNNSARLSPRSMVRAAAIARSRA